MLNHRINNLSNDFQKEENESKTEWTYVLRFGLVFAFYAYFKCYFFFEYGVYFDFFSEITGIVLLFISIPFEMSLAILLLRTRYLRTDNIDMFMTSSFYLIFAYSFAITRPFDMSFSDFFSHFDFIMMIQSTVGVALYSIPLSIVTVSLVNFIIKNYEVRKTWEQNKSSRS